MRLRDLNLDADPPTIHICEGIKNKYRDRFIPLNEHALKAFQHLLKRANRLGAAKLDHYLLPHRGPNGHNGADPTRQMFGWRKAWEEARKAAGLPNLRIYDLRHHSITRFLEQENISERTVTELAGHVSREMPNRYSHIRMSTKKAAVDALAGARVLPEPQLNPSLSPSQKPSLQRSSSNAYTK